MTQGNSTTCFTSFKGKISSIALVLRWYCIAILELWYCIVIVLLEKSQYCSSLINMLIFFNIWCFYCEPYTLGKVYTFCHHPIWYKQSFSLLSCLVFLKPDLSMSETKHQAQQNKTFLIAKEKLTVTESNIFLNGVYFYQS